ncbi:MAG: LamG domain-containing protein [Verrucomicrobiales bacterium]|nr:LamG domain-containing protein [Verrucomicrobiales bacterium]
MQTSPRPPATCHPTNCAGVLTRCMACGWLVTLPLGLSAVEPAYPAAVLADSPAAYWRLNETRAITGELVAADASGHDHAFAYQPTPTRTGTSPDEGPRPPEFPGFTSDNRAPTLVGGPLVANDGYVGRPTGVLPDRNDYTVELWFRRGPVAALGAYLYHRSDFDAPSNTGDYLGLVQNGDFVYLFIYDGTPGTGVNGFGYTDIWADAWNHVVLVREGENVTVYLNGQVEIPATYMPSREGTKWTDGSWAFGGRSDVPALDQRFNGNLDEIAVYPDALSATAVEANFSAATRAGGRYHEAVLARNPEAYWRLNETATVVGTDTAADATPGDHDFPYQTNSRSGTGTEVGPRPPVYAGFEGTNNAPTMPGSGYLGVASGVLPDANDYTAELWFRRGPVGSIGAYLYHRSDLDALTNTGDYLGLWPTGRNVTLFVYDGGADIIAAGRTEIVTNRWYHVAMVRQGEDVTVYLDGQVEIAAARMPLREGTKWTDGTWAFGGRTDQPALAQHFAGEIDEIAIYPQVLDRTTVLRHFNTAFATPTYANALLVDAPVAYWKLDETRPAGATNAVDASGHGHGFAYHATPTRTGTGTDVGPRPPEFPGFEASNSAPTLYGGPLTATDGYLGFAAGVLNDVYDYTIEMWLRRGAVGSIGAYLYHRSDLDALDHTGDYVGIWPAGDGASLFLYDGGADVIATGPTILGTTAWYHVAVQREGDFVTVYLNGETEIPATYMPLREGTKWSDGTWAFAGRTDMPQLAQRLAGNLDEIAIYNRVLSPTVLQAHYAAATGSAGNYAATVLADQPEAYWRLDEPQAMGGEVALDTSGNGNDFTYHKAPSRTGEGDDVGPRLPLFAGFPDDNRSPTLTGGPLIATDGYLGIPTGVSPGTNDYTIELWFRPTALGDLGAYLYHRRDPAAPSNTGDYLGLTRDGGVIKLFVYDGGAAANALGASPIKLGQWHHVALARAGNSVTVYLDGAVDIPATSMPPLPGTQWTAGTWAFGGRNDQPTLPQRFTGNLDEIVIFDVPLSQEQILAHYRAAAVQTAGTQVAIELSAGNVVISWPATPDDFVLESSPGLAPPNWAPVSATVVEEDGLRKVTFPPSAIHEFFRLRR